MTFPCYCPNGFIIQTSELNMPCALPKISPVGEYVTFSTADIDTGLPAHANIILNPIQGMYVNKKWKAKLEQ